ncbi:hypothetical protein F5Y17DRAFT_204004 [Xylariaceae sp. FL0594]|nr:hypothetical protein F5Y17DRAFT_204004 [Xylariaceae sp. FL0594]
MARMTSLALALIAGMPGSAVQLYVVQHTVATGSHWQPTINHHKATRLSTDRVHTSHLRLLPVCELPCLLSPLGNHHRCQDWRPNFLDLADAWPQFYPLRLIFQCVQARNRK